MVSSTIHNVVRIVRKYLRFIGPGLMVSVAYMDPGNYSTAVAAGSAYKYKLLFSILLSNCLAIFLQILSARLGCVTGLDLAANCKVHLPHRINILVYIMAEIAIIATDLAEVVGTAIALNILFKLPLILGVVITIVDVLIVLMAYRPKGPLIFIRIFEGFVSVLVAATVVCFGIELFQVSHDSSINFSTIEVLKGFLPNEKVIDMSDRTGGNGLFLSLAILGATVMPHSLYLGSGLVQARLKDYDLKNGHYHPHEAVFSSNSESPMNDSNKDADEESDSEETYRPSIHAINETMLYTIVELVISLFTVALFVNAAILIVAGATLSNKKNPGSTFFFTRDDDDHQADTDDSDNEDNNKYGNADLFTIYHLLSSHLSKTAGVVFALALLFSGQSAGIVCTLAGQMVAEGFLSWSISPVKRRLITRSLAIIPCFIVVTITGREGLSNILNFSQVILSLLLPFVTAPLIIFTCSKEIMKVPIFHKDGDDDIEDLDIQEPVMTTSTLNDTTRAGDKQRFKSTQPAIKLQDLRKSHPCAGGWDDEDEHQTNEENMRLIDGTVSDQPSTNDPTFETRTLIQGSEDDVYRVKGFVDLSNGPITSMLAILVWSFITLLNLFLIGSMIMGYDVPL